MTSTAPAPLPITVEETDTYIRHPSDVFTGDNRRTLTKGEWERAHALTYGGRKHDEFCSFAGPDAPCRCGSNEATP